MHERDESGKLAVLAEQDEAQLAAKLLGLQADFPAGLRAVVLQRDGGRCQICGRVEGVEPVDTEIAKQDDLAAAMHSRSPRHMLSLCPEHRGPLADREVVRLKIDYDAYREYIPGNIYPLIVDVRPEPATADMPFERVPYEDLHYYQSREERLGEHAHRIREQMGHLDTVEGVTNLLRGLYLKEYKEMRLHVLEEGVEPGDLPGNAPLRVKEGESWAKYCERIFGIDVNTANNYIRDYEQIFESPVLDCLADRLIGSGQVELPAADETEEPRTNGEDPMAEQARRQAFNLASAVPHSTRLEITRVEDPDQRAELLERAAYNGISAREMHSLVRSARDERAVPSCANCLFHRRLSEGEALSGPNNLRMRVENRGLSYCEIYGHLISTMSADRAMDVADNCQRYRAKEGGDD